MAESDVSALVVQFITWGFMGFLVGFVAAIASTIHKEW